MERGVFTSVYQKEVAEMCRFSRDSCASSADPEYKMLLSFIMPRGALSKLFLISYLWYPWFHYDYSQLQNLHLIWVKQWKAVISGFGPFLANAIAEDSFRVYYLLPRITTNQI